MAEGVLRHKAEQRGIALEVDSAGTAGYHIGEAPDRRSVAKSREYGIDISMLRGRQFAQHDFDDFDRIFVMDASNHGNVMRLARNASDETKVEMLLNLSQPGRNMEVPDPYYGGEDGFEHVYQLIDAACEVFLDQLNA